MGLTKIFQSPEGFLIPNYCFEKRFSKYLFFDSSILNSGDENNQLFFEVLNRLYETIDSNHLNPNWQLLIPFDQEWSFWGHHNVNGSNELFNNNALIKKDLTNHSSLLELKTYQEIFCENICTQNETKGHRFNQLVPIFWLTLEDKIAIYASNHEEIIIIGIDTESNLSEIENDKNITPFLYESIEDYIQFWSRIVSGRISEDKFMEFKSFFK